MIQNKLFQRFARYAWLLSTALLLVPTPSCQKESAAKPAPPTTPQAPEPTGGRLISSTLIGEYDQRTLAGRVASVPLVGALAQHPIKVYKLTYSTRNTDGQDITASGALLVPVTTKALPLLSYQHGTISPSSESMAPSYYSSSSEVWSAVSVLASTGYIVSAPDYIGYGASKALPHPYEHAPSLASASLDMLRAAREFCQKQQVQLNKKNFLLGYSEGGFATMALHKLIEEQASNEFTVTASAPGAGAYHKTAFAKYILNSTQPLNFLNSYVWVLNTYNRVYDIRRPLTHYYNQPYATQLQSNPFTAVPKQVQQLFTESFRTSVLNNNDAPMSTAFRNNDVYDWKPKAPLALFHGTADDYVPFFNSQDAYDAMRAKGATQVQLRPIQGGNHFSAAGAYTLEAFGFISQYY
ncbi:alpha/beta hydrolase family protein [Hymenobacter latericus]|uniref:alpha/beta hydrolase family protein n=1 Tax=Hymenobacter sp. YIM 151858-1 TaxID=2987688 RepID=UPI0022275F20|nr:lipase family protein [Hymenobacter sp. YIM 151858-1]UYZ58572.1 lipase family protein [Hymenobacter sp. YIM 151858-1]